LNQHLATRALEAQLVLREISVSKKSVARTAAEGYTVPIPGSPVKPVKKAMP
jgi:hypothetical protein